jgi:hypothetical protein
MRTASPKIRPRTPTPGFWKTWSFRVISDLPIPQPMMLSMMLRTAPTMTMNSYHHQNCDREARPLNVA